MFQFQMILTSSQQQHAGGGPGPSSASFSSKPSVSAAANSNETLHFTSHNRKMDNVSNLISTSASRRTGLFYDTRLLHHVNLFEPSHPEHPDRIRLCFARLKQLGFVDKCVRIQADGGGGGEGRGGGTSVDQGDHSNGDAADLGLKFVETSGVHSPVYINEIRCLNGKIFLFWRESRLSLDLYID